MLLNKSAITSVSEILKADDFYRPNNGLIYQAIIDLSMAGEPADAVTISAELAKRGYLTRIGGAPYLHTLISEVPVAGNAAAYAKIVKEKAHLRRLIEAGTRLVQLGYSDVGGDEIPEVMAQANRFLQEVNEPVSSGGMLKDIIQEWRNWQETDAGVIPTPWPELNKDLPAGGFAVGSLIVVGGRPGGGKSNAGLNVALEAAEKGHKTTVFSVEMDRKEVLSRVLAAATWSPVREIIGRNMEKGTWERVEEWIATNEDIPLEIQDKAYITVEDIVAHCRARRPEVLFVDYAQLIIASNPRLPRHEQVSHITRTLKVAAKELQMVVIAASQLNRGNTEGKGRLPTMEDLRESGSVEQDADVVLLLHRDQNNPNVVKLICAKNRNGPTRMHDLVFRGALSRVG
jgi:replicative DNA helicase